MLCAAMMTEHWEHVAWERAALAALANTSNTVLHWLLDDKVAKVEVANNRKGGGGTFLVPMNGGIWTMCVSLEGMQNLSISCAMVCLIVLGSAALVGTFGVCKHQISAVLVTGVMYLLAGLFAMFTLMIIHFKRIQRVSTRSSSHGDDTADGVVGPRIAALPLLSAREFTTSWSLELGWGGVALATTTSLLWILLSKIMRYNPISTMLL
ncbi:hypothetical protein RR48_07892 [Papilio machaon]|uniref:Uncharacterized protein n=1 Tax=Papilio machaon TaxID=76193 RepID=A0A194QTN8_PAPMA|nr:hypothetical protein RR48_07892 [Papilio machaon]